MIVSRRSCLLLAVLILSAAAVAQTAKVSSVLDLTEFVRDWQISKRFTIDVANAMPADLYSFKPNPYEMSFGEQMIHMAGGECLSFQSNYRNQAAVCFRPREATRVRQRGRAEVARSVVRLRY